MTSYRRLTDKTLKKYEDILAAGGELTTRQQSALDGHYVITDTPLVEAMLRPDKVQARATTKQRVSTDDAPGQELQPVGTREAMDVACARLVELEMQKHMLAAQLAMVRNLSEVYKEQFSQQKDNSFLLITQLRKSDPDGFDLIRDRLHRNTGELDKLMADATRYRAEAERLGDDIEEVIALLDDHEHTDDDTARRAAKHLLEIALLGQGNAQSGATTPTEYE